MSIKRAVPSTILISLIFSLLFTSIVQAEELSQEKINLMKAAGVYIPGYEEVDESSVNITKEEAIAISKAMLDQQENFEVSNIRLENMGPYGSRHWYIDFWNSNRTGVNGSVSIDADTGEIMNFNIWENNYYGQKNFIAKLTREEARVKAEEYLEDIFKIDPETLKLNEEYKDDHYYRNGIKEPINYYFTYKQKLNDIVINNSNISITVDGTDGSIRSYYKNKVNLDISKLPSSEGVMEPEKIIEKYTNDVNMDLQYITMYENRPYYGAYASQGRAELVYAPEDYNNIIDAFTGKMLNYDGTEYIPVKTENNFVPLDPEAVLEEGKPVTEEEVASIAQKYKKIAEELLGVKFQDNNQSNYYTSMYGEYEDVWNANWHYNDESMNANFNISVNCKTGRINNLNIDKYNYNYEYEMKMNEGQQPEIVEKVNWQQGKKKAIEIIGKILPEQYGFYASQDLTEPVIKDEYKKNMQAYNYSFIRLVNGIKYRDNSIYVSINRETGDICNLYFNWQDRDFPENSGIISLDEASKIFSDSIEAQLSYFSPENDEIYKAIKEGQEIEAPVPRLAYFIKNRRSYMDRIIDAKTGKLMDWSGRSYENQTDISQIPDHPAKRSVELLISQGIIKELKPFESEITRGEAVRFMSLTKGMSYFEEAKDTGMSFVDISKDNEYYYYIENAIRYGIVDRTGGRFRAGEKITKDEYVKLLVNMLGYSDIAKYNRIFNKEGFEQISDDVIGSVAICSAFEILPGGSAEEYDGSSTVTFAEAAESLYKALYYIR
jgi:uncharacterized membrane protein YkoI